MGPLPLFLAVSAKRPTARTPASMASRVFPAPPVPVNVTPCLTEQTPQPGQLLLPAHKAGHRRRQVMPNRRRRRGDLLAQHRLLQRPELLPRLEPQFLIEHRPGPPVGRQRIGLTLPPVQRQRRRAPSRSRSGYSLTSLSSSPVISPCWPASMSASSRASTTASRDSSSRAASNARRSTSPTPASAGPRHSASASGNSAAAATGSPLSSAVFPAAAGHSNRRHPPVRDRR